MSARLTPLRFRKPKAAPVSAHSPGPWETANLYVTHNGVQFATVNCTGPAEPESGARAYANANLIAASPELLAACEATFAAGSIALGQLPEDALGLSALIGALASARAAIAKARGGK